MSEIDPLESVPTPPEFMQAASVMRIAFDDGDMHRFGMYLAMLLEANRHFNLTAIEDEKEAWTRHILDSLTLLPILNSLDVRTVIDIGSGGGLPGVPLAIAMPQMQFTLVEATGKKARFLEGLIRPLELGNVRVVNERAETIGQDRANHREKYDAVLARAVGRLPVLLELAAPLAKVGGHVLAMKGQKAAEEIAEAKKALHLLHSHVVQTVETSTGVVVVIEKQRATPKMYPRPPGEPKRAPL